MPEKFSLAECMGVTEKFMALALKDYSAHSGSNIVGFADGMGGNTGINILGGAPPEGTSDFPSTSAIDSESKAMEPVPGEKKEKEKEPKATGKPDENAAPDADAVKSSLQAISSNADTDKEDKSKAEQFAAEIEEAKNDLAKKLKEADAFAQKNAPKPAEGSAAAPEAGAAATMA